MTFLMSEPGDDPVVVEGWFRAEPARVFRAWTEPDAVKQWFGHRPKLITGAEIDLRQGGAWRFTFPATDEKSFGFEGVYEEIRPSERLVFTWRRFDDYVSGRRDASHYSRVEVVFSVKGAGTTVRLVHSALPSAEAARGFGGGWNGAFGNLETVFGGA